MNELLIVHPGQSLASGVQISTLSELDHVVDVLSDGTGANESSLNTSVSDSFCGKRSEKGLSLISGLAELLESLAVGNHAKLGAGSLLGKADGTSGERTARGYKNTQNVETLKEKKSLEAWSCDKESG